MARSKKVDTSTEEFNDPENVLSDLENLLNDMDDTGKEGGEASTEDQDDFYSEDIDDETDPNKIAVDDEDEENFGYGENNK